MGLAVQCPGEASQEALGARLAGLCLEFAVIYLMGDLGAGKTTLARGFLRGLGHAGVVKSPTYTLIEPYHPPRGRCFHLDLYRLSDPEELYFLGIDDLVEQGWWLVEWPEQGGGLLPPADLEIRIEYCEAGRCLRLMGVSAVGQRVLTALARERGRLCRVAGRQTW